MLDETRNIITPEHVGGGIVGLTGIWLLFKKVLVKSAIEDTNLSSSEAYNDVINLLRQEVQRLNENNTMLVRELSELHVENSKLRGEVTALKDTVAVMRTQLEVLQLRKTDIDYLDGKDRRSKG